MARVSAAAALVLLAATAAAQAQTSAPLVLQTEDGLVLTPDSSRTPAPGFAHTHYHRFVPYNTPATTTTPSGRWETPASLACVYGVTAPVAGCNPETLTTVATGGSKAIAIVDAYDDPNAAADLEVYSAYFGLPHITAANFEVVYQSGTKKPPVDKTGGWEGEESLDIEMAHALAPNAKIFLVEANSSSNADLYAAEKIAIGLVAAAGGGEVSNSWGGPESANEATSEATFTGTNVVVFASAGDKNGPESPSILPNVIGVGGTTIQRTAAGNYTGQTTWTSTGGGISKYIARPTFQSADASVLGTKRGAPDISLIANPQTGVWVYDSYKATPGQEWGIIGGTSAAAPLAAALVNAAGSFAASTTAELTTIYASASNTADFTDITAGRCANDPRGHAEAGYDLCTGVGTPLGLAGK